MLVFAKKYSLLVVFCVLILAQITLAPSLLKSQGSGQLTFSMMDIGQGDALYIEAPNGNQIIVDGGPGPQILRELAKVMPFGDRVIDAIVVTNPDSDHYAGFFDVLSRYSVGAVVESGTTNPSSLYTNFENTISEQKIPHLVLKKGDTIDLGSGAILEILFPDQDVSKWGSNDGSLVMRLSYGSSSILLTGDTTAKIESYLLRTQKNSIQSNILKTAHHGSRTSSLSPFVQVVHPDVAVISAGKENKYGHPHPETIHTFETLKIPYFVTAKEGNLTYISDGHTWVKK